MDKKDLRPSLVWRRVVPGIYAAETATGETYLVEKTDDGWRVVLRGPRGGREVLGQTTRIKWIGQCRAENHRLAASRTKDPPAPKLSPERVAAAAKSVRATAPGKPPAPVKADTKSAAATPETPKSEAVRGAGKSSPQTSRRRRRAEPAKPTAPTKPVDPLPSHTLAWKVSQQNGREFHVAEHEGGLFKIIEVKGTEGFALFAEPADGVVQEIQCGSLDECKQTATSMQTKRGGGSKARRAGKKTEAAEPAEKGKKTEAAEPAEKTGAAGPAEKTKVKRSGGGTSEEAKPASEACGCDPPAAAKKAPRGSLDAATQSRLVDGLRAALRKVEPPTAREG